MRLLGINKNYHRGLCRDPQQRQQSYQPEKRSINTTTTLFDATQQRTARSRSDDTATTAKAAAADTV